MRKDAIPLDHKDTLYKEQTATTMQRAIVEVRRMVAMAMEDSNLDSPSEATINPEHPEEQEPAAVGSLRAQDVEILEVADLDLVDLAVAAAEGIPREDLQAQDVMDIQEEHPEVQEEEEEVAHLPLAEEMFHRSKTPEWAA